MDEATIRDHHENMIGTLNGRQLAAVMNLGDCVSGIKGFGELDIEKIKDLLKMLNKEQSEVILELLQLSTDEMNGE